MTHADHDDDRDLRERFQALRREDSGRTPSFQTTLVTGRARRAAESAPRRRALGLAVATAVAAGVALVLLFSQHGRPGVAVDLATAHWEAPTDFLLRIPGDELLRTVPQLGRVNVDWRTP